MNEHLPECPVWRCCKPDERATMHMCICPDDERIGGLITRQIAEKIGRRIGQYGCVIPEQQHLPECPCEPCICSYLRACEERVRSNRLVEAIFHAPDSGARAFVLQRITDASGVSGTGIVAHGAEFPDGCVALRWVGSNPTSVVFHDNGISSVQAIHGHGGNTQIVWTSEDMGERAAEMDECQRRGYADAIAECILLGYRHIDRVNEEAEAAISEQVANQLFMNADGIEFFVSKLRALQTLRKEKK